MNELANLFDALEFASKKHRDQRRLDVHSSPYINHPIAVAALLARSGVTDLAVLKSAILHDVLEDTMTTYDELLSAFGEEVTSVVMEVTDDKSLPKAERKRLQVEHASTLSRSAGLVKLADKTCNLLDVADNPPKNWSLARRQEYFEWANSVVSQLSDMPKELLDSFQAAYSRIPKEVAA